MAWKYSQMGMGNHALSVPASGDHPSQRHATMSSAEIDATILNNKPRTVTDLLWPPVKSLQTSGSAPSTPIVNSPALWNSEGPTGVVPSNSLGRKPLELSQASAVIHTSTPQHPTVEQRMDLSPVDSQDGQQRRDPGVSPQSQALSSGRATRLPMTERSTNWRNHRPERAYRRDYDDIRDKDYDCENDNRGRYDDEDWRRWNDDVDRENSHRVPDRPRGRSRSPCRRHYHDQYRSRSPADSELSLRESHQDLSAPRRIGDDWDRRPHDNKSPRGEPWNERRPADPSENDRVGSDGDQRQEHDQAQRPRDHNTDADKAPGRDENGRILRLSLPADDLFSPTAQLFKRKEDGRPQRSPLPPDDLLSPAHSTQAAADIQRKVV